MDEPNIEEYPSVIAIIPMKPLVESKTRLGRSFTREQRADLALGMLRRVISAVQSASVGLFWVVGGDERVRSLTRNSDGVWLEDMGRDLNDTLTQSFDRAFKQGHSAMYLAADLPFLKTSDVHSVLQASRRQNNICLAPARRDGGTNAILVPAGTPFLPELGHNSFIRHLSQAAKLGVSVAICYSPGLGFDLDTPSDLETYELMEPGLMDRLVPRRASSSPSGQDVPPWPRPGGD
ncbi:MAG: 2-phospho-L-lactate guanylyltransferase [Dehalococcoidia bacterium]|jgi:2-phospho-L-lactate guanylyltransferase|nr:2-phospho-L-lactate guanylyltransferase [Dehalococcoidia bacterium]